MEASTASRGSTLKAEVGPFGRAASRRYFTGVRFTAETERELRALHERGFVVHVMRSTAWVNFLYLVWAMVTRGLPPVRAVVNLRRWFTRPWRRVAQRGDMDVRFTYARRNQGSALVFLKRTSLLSPRSRYAKEDPFPTLVKMARKSDKPVFLVPELFVWERQGRRLQARWFDRVFGSPEAPGFLHSVVAFWRNRDRAQFRVGEPIDLKKFVEENPDVPDEVLARKVRSALHHHLARETRAVFGAPLKPTWRLIEEILRDRGLRRLLDEHAAATGRRPQSVHREAERALKAIAARPSPGVIGLAAGLMKWILHRIYDGIEVDEEGLERALKAAGRAPLVLCPSHKSHLDYLVMSYVLWSRGYMVPHIAAGANLSFFPIGSLFRRAGAFFLRRSFKGDVVYTAAFKAYIKKLVHEGSHQEFFPEGGRSRTGKLLPARLGMLSWEVDAVLDGAARDLYFVPAAIDYERIAESSSYSKELAGGEKQKEDLRALLTAPKVLLENFGRIHISFDEPISLKAFAAERGLDLEDDIDDEEKRRLVRALGHRIMFGISRVCVVTAHALVSAVLLGHRRRGITAEDLSRRIALLRRIVLDEGAKLPPELVDAPDDPLAPGPVKEALRTFARHDLVHITDLKKALVYEPVESHRPELAFYKNTLMNLLAPRTLVANALLAAPHEGSVEEVKARALFLSRLFKHEFLYRVGVSFDELFAEAADKLVADDLIVREGDALRPPGDRERRAELELIADLLRDSLEAYHLAACTLSELTEGPVDRKGFVKSILDDGRVALLSGKLSTAEALAKVTVDNAVGYFLDQGILIAEDKKVALGPDAQTQEQREALATELRTYLNRRAA